MARILLTNNAKWANDLRTWFARVGFKEFARTDVCDMFLSVYRKLNLNTYNLYSDGSDCVACAGTFIYNGKIGRPALADLLQDTAHGFDLRAIRAKALGCYVVAIKKQDQVYIFVDEYHTYSIYYFMDGEHYIITNNFSHIESVTHQPLNRCKTLEYVVQFNIVGNMTPYDNIYKLMGNQYLVLDLKSHKYTLKQEPDAQIQTARYSSLDVACTDISGVIKKYSHIKSQLFKKTCLFITGGVDSRLMLASYLSVGTRPRLVRWHGQDGVLNSRVEDYYASKALAQQTHLPFKNYFAKENFCKRFNKVNKKDMYKYGDLMLKYGDNHKWHKIYDKIKADFLDYGYFGETLVDWDKMDSLLDFSKNISLKDFVYNLYIDNQATNGWKHQSEYRDMIYNEFLDIATGQNIDCDNLSREDCMLLFFYYRLHADTHMVNFSNMYSHYFPLLSQPGIIEKIHNTPYAFKQNHKLNLRLIRALCPALLNITFFSHGRYRTTDIDSLELHEDNSNTKKNGWLANIMCKIKFGKSYIKKDKKVQKCCIANSQDLAKRLEYNLDRTKFYYLPLYTTFTLLGKMDSIINDQGVK